jgi:tRNA threonylcarbamoyladenosine biosynthesis protein TsaE
VSILETRILRWPDEAACAASARALAAHAALRDAFVELHGPLGAGKTTFVRHLLRALGVQGRVKSPTYTVLESYDAPGVPGESGGPGGAPLTVHHFDFYRFDDPQEWEDAGFREVFAGPGLKLAEWPQKAEALLPEADLTIAIEPEPPARAPADGGSAAAEPRRVTLAAHTPRGRALLD